MRKAKQIYEKFLKPKEIIAYSAGLFGFQMVLGYVNSYQAEFYSASLSANLALVGILLIVAKAASAVFDPIIGNLIDRQKGKYGKLKPFIIYSILPILVLSVLVFVKVPFTGAGLYAYIFLIYLLWCVSMSLADVPTQGFAAVMTQSPMERTNVVSIANTAKSIGFSACYVVIPVVSWIVPGGAGLASGTLNDTEYLVSAVVVALVGVALLALIFFFNKERVPYKAKKISAREMVKAVKNNKAMLIVVLLYLTGFARQTAMAIQVQAAVAILGSANRIILLGISCAIGSVISMALVPVLVKRFNEKIVFIGMSVYGFVICIITYFVGFKNIYAMLTCLFLVGLQFGAINIIPMLMTADAVDYYEYKTDKRMEGLYYSVLSISIKLSLALGAGLGLILLEVFDYSAADGAVLSEATRKGVYFTYVVVPGISTLIGTIPVFFYDLVGEKKTEINRALAERRAEKRQKVA